MTGISLPRSATLITRIFGREPSLDEQEGVIRESVPNPTARTVQKRRRLRKPALCDLVGPKAGPQHPQSPDPRSPTAGRRSEALTRERGRLSPPAETEERPRGPGVVTRAGGFGALRKSSAFRYLTDAAAEFFLCVSEGRFVS